MGEMAIGMIGLGVMGRNLALNMEEKGFSVAAWDAWPEPVERFIAASQGKQIQGFKDLEAFVKSIRRPRRIILLVKAGEVVDKTLALLRPFLDPGDLLVDGGNEYYVNTERRTKELAAVGIRYFGMGVSGGELGARNGPSLMPGGDKEGYKELEPILTKIAAQHADGWNVPFLAPETFAHKNTVLNDHCATGGRDPSTIERAANVGIAMRPGDLEAQFGKMSKFVSPGVLQGSVGEIADRVGAYGDAGADWLILAMRAPFDLDGLDLFASEVLPQLQDR